MLNKIHSLNCAKIENHDGVYGDVKIENHDDIYGDIKINFIIYKTNIEFAGNYDDDVQNIIITIDNIKVTIIDIDSLILNDDDEDNNDEDNNDGHFSFALFKKIMIKNNSKHYDEYKTIVDQYDINYSDFFDLIANVADKCYLSITKN